MSEDRFDHLYFLIDQSLPLRSIYYHIMKNLLLTSILAVTALGLSSCCCLFSSNNRYKTEETYLAGYKTVTKEVAVGNGSKGGFDVQTVQERVPVYKTRTVSHRVKCVRTYCPRDGACGTPGDKLVKMSTAQGGVGSPHIGLVPTMRSLAP